MKALVFDKKLTFERNFGEPKRRSGEALIKILKAGICNTDLEIIRGYKEFAGILGHEFVGVVEDADTQFLVGKRVVGEINCGCGECHYCSEGMTNHCPNRTVLGILNRNGAFAEYLTLPAENLHIVPDNMEDEVAVFTEPTAAAFEILKQLQLKPTDKILVLGDGKLGLLISQVMHLNGGKVTTVGRHPHKLAIISEQGIHTFLEKDFDGVGFDVVVVSTGSTEGLEKASDSVRPCGTIVLKSTVADEYKIDLAPIVVNEIKVVGSRCGPFEPALQVLTEKSIKVKPMISARYQIEDGLRAIEDARKKETIKVILDVASHEGKMGKLRS